MDPGHGRAGQGRALTAAPLADGWQVAQSAPNRCQGPGDLEGLDWMAARVPGTAAGALRDAGIWRAGEAWDFDGVDWWFRTRFQGEPAADGEEVWLALDGIATVSEVYLNGERVLDSDSMFAAHLIDASQRLRGGGAGNELVVCCRALGPLLRERRRPRARWRTRLVSDGNLRFYRTMLLGRAPGFSPGPACVGPWKPIRLERPRGVAVDAVRLRTELDGPNGRLSVRGQLRPLHAGQAIGAVSLELDGPNGARRAPLAVHPDHAQPNGVAVAGELAVPGVERWWPHTHGVPALHEVTLRVNVGADEIAVSVGRIGFRDLRSDGELGQDGIQLRVNDVPVFARGAVWTPVDLAAPCSGGPELESVLDAVARAGMNMLRVPGIGCYESEAFYDRCDQLGILVWQDFMLANLDYPEQDAAFMASVEREARQVLADLARRPSLAVLCGGSEVAQQVAMLGLDPQLAHGPLYGELLPSLVAEADVQAPYVPSTPWGGDVPFRPGQGVAHYYGVGAYLRPLEDARRAEVRFAAESLAFANVPDEETVEMLGGPAVHTPRWKAGVPRDTGAGWDFEDVRDHYLRLLYQLDAVGLRSVDPERYLELSRHLTGEVMAETFGEWRRAASPCGGALVLWLTDLYAGAGWGVLDSAHRCKVAYHYLRRALSPVAVWSVDEGLGGVVVHVANDRPERLHATLRIGLYRDLELVVEQVSTAIDLGPHHARAENIEELLGRFVDLSWSYRFGPPGQDLIVLSLENGDEERPLSQSFRFPAGRTSGTESASQLGLRATFRSLDDRSATVTVATRRLAYGVRLHLPGFVADDDAFGVEPGHARTIELRPVNDVAQSVPRGHLTALNLVGRVPLEAA
jgi:beta-mannosidase